MKGMQMLNKLDSALDFHQTALRVRGQRQELIAANIANADNQDSFKQGSFLCAIHAQPARALNESSRPILPVQGVAVPINKGCRHQYDVAMAWAGVMPK